MNARQSLLCSVLIGGFVSSAVGEPLDPVSDPAGTFRLPFNEGQSWSKCDSSGWAPYGDSDSHQYHMQLNAELPDPKYHLGEDWNGICGGDSDEGAPLLALGAGKVVYLDDEDDSAKGKQLYIRYSFPYSLAPDDVQTFDSVYLHINDIDSSNVQWSGLGTGSTVSEGDVVAHLGGTGGLSPHLHWEMQWDASISVSSNPYQNPLSKSHALKYRAPSIVVDDRRDEVVHSVSTDGYYTIFTMSGNAPSSTAYVQYNGERKSLKKAIEAGWMENNYLLFKEGGSWYYYHDVDDNFFEEGGEYAISANVSGAELHIPVPRNTYQEDRARLDMLHAVEHESEYEHVLTDEYGHDPDWGSSWELHWMGFETASGEVAYANQATLKSNRLVRYVTYYDPGTGEWTDWQLIDWNRLY